MREGGGGKGREGGGVRGDPHSTYSFLPSTPHPSPLTPHRVQWSEAIQGVSTELDRRQRGTAEIKTETPAPATPTPKVAGGKGREGQGVWGQGEGGARCLGARGGRGKVAGGARGGRGKVAGGKGRELKEGGGGVYMHILCTCTV